jgi:hypothetical protein
MYSTLLSHIETRINRTGVWRVARYALRSVEEVREVLRCWQTCGIAIDGPAAAAAGAAAAVPRWIGGARAATTGGWG